MFGESESESPRVPSPWDVVLAPASVDKLHYRQDELLLPKLAAEVEEGNVEYKLHLINPSSARFARLVTQMKWRLLEGGGQAIYELGVADSGALVGLAPDDLRASLDTLYAMAEVGLRAQVDKRHGGRDSRRAAVKYKNNSRAQALPIEAAVLYSSVTSTSTSTPSSLDSMASLMTDSCSLASDSSTLSSPLLPASSVNIRTSIHETVHGDDSLLFLMLADSSPRCSKSAESLIGGGESFIGHDINGTLEKSFTSAESRLELHCAQHEGDIDPEPAAIVATAVDALPDPDEVLQTAFGKLQVADNPSAPDGHKRTIVEALVTRELDKEEGFLDFASF